MGLAQHDGATVGQRLRALRLWRGMTQAEVAGLAGLTDAYLSMAERGLRTIDKRSTIAALAVALRVSESDLTGGPHLSRDVLQAGPHAAIPDLRVALSVNSLGEPAGECRRSLGKVVGDVEGLRSPHGGGDYMALGAHLPGLLGELFYHVSAPADEAAAVEAARALTDACVWTAAMCHDLHYPDLAQLAARSALDAAGVTDDPVRVGMAQFVRIGTAPQAWERSLAMAESAANQLQPYARSAVGLQVLGMLTLRAALSAAVLQDGALADHWLGEADTIAARVDDEDPAGNWEWFGATNVTCWRVVIAVERAESGRVVRAIAGGADPARLVVATRHAALLLDVGRALARDPATEGEAVSWLRQAEQAAPQFIRNYAPAREAVTFLLTRAKATAGGRELRGMAARMGIMH